MASVIGRVAAVFSASTNGLTTGIDEATRSLKKMQDNVSGLKTGMGALTAIQGAQLFGQIAAFAGRAVGSLYSMAGAQAEVIDGTSKLAARLGFTYSELAGLALAGDLAGVSMATIGAAATKADVAFVRAAGGSKTAIGAFKNLGLSVESLNGLSASERFDKIAEAIASIPDESQRAAAAIGIFGRSGAQLLPLFSGGAAGIAAARAEAERFGLTLTNMQGTNVESMNDAFTRAQQAVKGVVGQIVAYLAPAVEAVTTTFSDFIGSVGGANIGQAIGEALLQGATFFAGIADYVIGNLGGVFEYAASVGQSWAAGWDLGGRVANALYGAFKLFEFVGNTIAGALAGIVSMLAKAIAGAADWIPGAQGAADYMNKVAADSFALGDKYMAIAGDNLAASGNAFGAAFSMESAPAWQDVSGPLSTTLQDAIAKAREAAAQKDVSGKTTLANAASSAGMAPATASVVGNDAASKEGISEMFRIMRGEGRLDIQERQLAVQERIADGIEGLGGGEDSVEYAFPE